MPKSKPIVYTMTETMVLYPIQTSAWHFLPITKKVGKEIREKYGKSAAGFGSLPVEVIIGETVWKTSIFPSKHLESYILPIKAKVRKLEDIVAGEKVKFSLKVGI